MTLQATPSNFETYDKLDSSQKSAESVMVNATSFGGNLDYAESCWRLISKQLKEVIGIEIHAQWFANVRPVIISNNVLVLETTNNFACRWINSHYQELADLLLSFQDSELTTFFISPSDKEKLDQNGRWH